jgi:hypothetical protein
MGKLKRRIRPSDITINIGKEAAIPKCPIEGERYQKVLVMLEYIFYRAAMYTLLNVMCFAAGKKSNMTILLHGWPFGTIQSAKKISSMFSWQQAAL